MNEILKFFLQDINHVETLGYCIDILLGFQIRSEIFKTVQDAINFFVMLQILPLKNAKNWFINGFSMIYFQKLWLQTVLKDFLDKLRTYPNVAKLTGKNLLISKFLNVDMKIMSNFLLNCLESEKSKENFDKFLEDYLVAQLSENSWKQLFLFRIDSLTEIHAKLILETITQELKYLNKTIDKEERIRELKSACLKLFSERHWKLSHFQDFIRKIKDNSDFKNLIELFNTVYELKIEKADLKISSDPKNWTKDAVLIATQKVCFYFLVVIYNFL